jgi:GNAT superfamily N-acetyltransferase
VLLAVTEIRDPLLLWAVQGSRGRAWRSGDAVVVATPELSKRDRMAVSGPVDQLVPLVRHVASVVGPTYRPFGDEAVVRELAEQAAEVEFSACFGWMDTPVAPPVSGDVGWLPDDRGVAELLTAAAPASYAWPGRPGVRAWAGVAEGNQLVSVAADAWSAPQVGFLAGVATAAAARGRGLSRAVCAFVTAELVGRHGRAGLMVDADNAAAISIYRRLGYTYRPVAAARISGT